MTGLARFKCFQRDLSVNFTQIGSLHYGDVCLSAHREYVVVGVCLAEDAHAEREYGQKSQFLNVFRNKNANDGTLSETY